MTQTIHQSTQSATGGIRDYAPIPRGTRALSIGVDDLRTRTDIAANDVQGLQEEVRQLDLAERGRDKARNDVPALLDELANVRGMAWTDIAEVARVTVSAVRKWRKGGDASTVSRQLLARYAALLDLLEEKGLIKDPAAWMEMDLPLGVGYFIRPFDLYLEGRETALLEIAEHRKPIEHILDVARPDWRDSRSKFEVFEDVDGNRSIRTLSE